MKSTGVEGWTFGAELEIADIDATVELPKVGLYDYKDYSICNSNGTANDPLKKLNRYGSEVHTIPAKSPEALARYTAKIYDAFQKKSFNWSTNLHVHVHIPGLADNLVMLRRLAEYHHHYGQRMFELVDPIPRPDVGACRNEIRRFKRRKRSHHYQVSEAVYQKMRKAKSTKEFYLAHAPINQKGMPQWQLVQRAGMSLLQLWRKPASTIEFRCFTMSKHLDRMLSAYQWCFLYLQAALYDGDSPEKILRSNPELSFQKFHKYQAEQDRIFRLTSLHENSRKVVIENYKRLIAGGWINEEELH